MPACSDSLGWHIEAAAKAASIQKLAELAVTLFLFEKCIYPKCFFDEQTIGSVSFPICKDGPLRDYVVASLEPILTQPAKIKGLAVQSRKGHLIIYLQDAVALLGYQGKVREADLLDLWIDAVREGMQKRSSLIPHTGEDCPPFEILLFDESDTLPDSDWLLCQDIPDIVQTRAQSKAPQEPPPVTHPTASSPPSHGCDQGDRQEESRLEANKESENDENVDQNLPENGFEVDPGLCSSATSRRNGELSDDSTEYDEIEEHDEIYENEEDSTLSEGDLDDVSDGESEVESENRKDDENEEVSDQENEEVWEEYFRKETENLGSGDENIWLVNDSTPSEPIFALEHPGFSHDDTVQGNNQNGKSEPDDWFLVDEEMTEADLAALDAAAEEALRKQNPVNSTPTTAEKTENEAKKLKSSSTDSLETKLRKFRAEVQQARRRMMAAGLADLPGHGVSKDVVVEFEYYATERVRMKSVHLVDVVAAMGRGWEKKAVDVGAALDSERWMGLPMCLYLDVLHRLKVISVNHRMLPANVPKWWSERAMRLQALPRLLDAANLRIKNVPTHLWDALLSFQREGVMFGLHRAGRCLIADEMGIGKTVQAIALASCYRDAWPLLVVVPAALRIMWAEELERWLPYLQPRDIHIVFGHNDKVTSPATRSKITITSYQMLNRLKTTLGEWQWGVVIFDESHHLRTSPGQDTHQTEVGRKVIEKATHAILLTGTPCLSHPFDMFNQIDALWKGLLGSHKYYFRREYCNNVAPTEGRKPVVKGSLRSTELNLILSDAVMIRRMKKDVLDLPPKRRTIVRVLDQDAYDRYLREKGDYQTQSMSYRKWAAMVKLEGAVAWLTEFMDRLEKSASDGNEPSNENAQTDELPANQRTELKVVVFAHHKDVMNRLAGHFNKMSWKYARIDGDCSAKDKNDAVKRFQRKPSVRIALVSMEAGGTGLDLSTATMAVFVESPNTSAILRQAEDRLHRKGQMHPVNIYYLSGPPGTEDDVTWQRLRRSLESVSAVQNGPEHTESLNADTVHSNLTKPPATTTTTTGEDDPLSQHPDTQTSTSTPLAPGTHTHMHQLPKGETCHLWYEVSRHTGRVHVYGSADSTSPLGASCPLHVLLDLPHTQDLLPPAFTPTPTAWIWASVFAHEYNKLGSLHRKWLEGKPVQPPLAAAISAIRAQQPAARASTRRHTPHEDMRKELPEGAEWKTVIVKTPVGDTKEYQQGFQDNSPLCLFCYKPYTTLQESYRDLFCGRDCYDSYAGRTNPGALRAVVFDRDRGVCQMCGVDVHSMCLSIRGLQQDQRKAVILKTAPKFANHPVRLQRLIEHPVEGNAWHVDHIVAVFEGGGECTANNCRTLCVCCHNDVTVQQARDRATKRRQEKKAQKLGPTAKVSVADQLKAGTTSKKRGKNLYDAEKAESAQSDQPIRFKNNHPLGIPMKSTIMHSDVGKVAKPKKSATQAPPLLDENGQPVKRKRGRPPKSQSQKLDENSGKTGVHESKKRAGGEKAHGEKAEVKRVKVYRDALSVDDFDTAMQEVVDLT